ncbi:polysaccharide pyruvyl transferase family protein [Serratia inhibens]|uniref:Polysaccharide pyruvyl transferase family protein n=1 Tax=Serratia inhibens TaxID=2338073 RepID=A0AA92X7E9_9GAMM|nr:polysaccharide pyruvyl transferase family protein [Serratia inhibens]RJF58399.1 polysaccharide pyruvyl transferase family protein [Serratia inhibens]
MKIAILTIPLNHNYGGNLQNYALQVTLKNMGHTPVTVNYKKGVRRSFARRYLSRIKRSLLTNKMQPPYKITEEEGILIEKNHANFIKEYIIISDGFYSEGELKEFFYKEKFDAVIVGSDQVWRPKYTPKIDPFFFSFLKGDDEIIKIAYGASFGTDVWEYTPEEMSICGNLIKDFDFVSVRESLGVEMCQKHFNISAEHVLDPTLLLNKKDYIDVLKRKDLPDNKGKIFNYILDSSGDKKELMLRVSEVLGKETFSTYPYKTIKDSFKINDIENYQYPPVEAWIKSFYDADFVVTDSFHGTVFSIIFNKPFIAISNKARGAARFTSLLKMFGLENRLVSDFADVNAEIINTSIDFDRVNAILESSKETSINLIRKALDIKKYK